MKRIQELMSKNIQSITPQTRLSEASQLMAHQNVAMLPVREQGRMRGVLTEHDIVSHVFELGRNPGEMRTQDVMSPKNYYCYASEEIEDVIGRMEDKHVSRLFVLDEQDQLVGELHSHQLEEAQEEDDGELEGLKSDFEEEGFNLSELILEAIRKREKKNQTRLIFILFSSLAGLGFIIFGVRRSLGQRLSFWMKNLFK